MNTRFKGFYSPKLLHRTGTFSGIVLILVLILNLAVPRTNLRAAGDQQYFPETGKSVSGKFLDYWRANGGLAVFGFPITEATEEMDPETGKTFLTQWFERNRFELHPENAGTRYEVLLGLLGKDLRREALEVDTTFLPASPSGKSNSRYFKETGHNLSELFLDYWQSRGGLERFGFPISEARNEVDPETGKVFLTQWFERARFEHHPENKGTDSEVLLGLLGKQLKTNPPAVQFRWEIFRYGFSQAITVDSQGNMWLAYETTPGDNPPSTTMLVKFDNRGRQLAEFRPTYKKTDGTTGSMTISAVTTDRQGNIYLGEFWQEDFKGDNIQIEKLDPQGHSLLTFGTNVSAGGGVRSIVRGLAVDLAGNIYTANYDSVVISRYDQTGKFLNQIGSSEDDLHPLVSPSQLVIDGEGNLIIADSTTYEVQKRDVEGNFVALLGNTCHIKASEELEVRVGLAVNPAGQTFISYAKNDPDHFTDLAICVERIGPDNTAEVVFKDGGMAMGQLWFPTGIAVDNENDLFVLNYKGQAADFSLDKFNIR